MLTSSICWPPRCALERQLRAPVRRREGVAPPVGASPAGRQGTSPYPVLLKSTGQQASESAKRRTRWSPQRLAARAVPSASGALPAACAAERGPGKATGLPGPAPTLTHRILIGQDRG